MDTNLPADIELAQPAIQAVPNDEDGLAQNRRLYAMLEPLALLGMGGPLLAAMTGLGSNVHATNKIAGYRLKFLAGPIICHSRTHELQNHPLNSNEHFKHFITADRLKWTLGLTQLPVGPAEVAMIMYEASLEAPLNSEMAELYIWATRSAMYRANPENLEMLKTVTGRFTVEGDPEQILADPMIRLTYFGFANEVVRKVTNASKYQKPA